MANDNEVPSPPPPVDFGHEIYRRLRGREPTAPSDLAVAYLDPLIAWLGAKNTRVSPEIIADAAGDAILALIRSPESYDPGRASLEAYLRMSAQGDLRNLLRREKKHRTRRISLQSVEHSEDAGKYLGKADDPALPAMAEESLTTLNQSVPPSVREGLTESEERVLELMFSGERRTVIYAKAFGVAELPPQEQRRLIKQVKDRLTKRLERARAGDERAT